MQSVFEGEAGAKLKGCNGGLVRDGRAVMSSAETNCEKKMFGYDHAGGPREPAKPRPRGRGFRRGHHSFAAGAFRNVFALSSATLHSPLNTIIGSQNRNGTAVPFSRFHATARR
jgi:hypothetical protein